MFIYTGYLKVKLFIYFQLTIKYLTLFELKLKVINVPWYFFLLTLTKLQYIF